MTHSMCSPSDSNLRPLLIIDMANLFIRCYVAFPQMSSNGYQMGGCIGSLKVLKKLITELQPSGVYLAWEGGGSIKRRKIYSEYKLGRKPERLNRFYGDDIPETENNRKHQILSLLQMTKCLPLHHIYVDDCEGDDVIAYLCKGPFANYDKIIASSDKDMYQLVDDKTRIYSFHRKQYLTKENIFEEFRITTSNFAIAKAICGDRGDNVPGIKGIGFKNIIKLYPFLGIDKEILLSDIIDYASSHLDESKLHKKVIEDQEIIKRNWKLLYLDISTLSDLQIEKIKYSLENRIQTADPIKLAKLIMKEGITDFSSTEYCRSFSCVDNFSF